MKTLICESCGSNDFLKGQGFYVCSSCGTKVVTSDNDAGTENLLKAARQAKDVGNWQLAANLYEQVFALDAENWEAVFFASACKAYECVIANITIAANQTRAAAMSALMLIQANIKDEQEQKKAVGEVATHCVILGKMMYEAAKNNYNSINDASLRLKYKNEATSRISAAFKLMDNCGETIDALFDGKEAGAFATVVLKEVYELAGKINVGDIARVDKETKERIHAIIVKNDKGFIEEQKQKEKNAAEEALKTAQKGIKTSLIMLIVAAVSTGISFLLEKDSFGQFFLFFFGIFLLVIFVFALLGYLFKKSKAKNTLSVIENDI